MPKADLVIVAALPYWSTEEYVSRFKINHIRPGKHVIPNQMFLVQCDAYFDIGYVLASIELNAVPKALVSLG